MPKRIKNQNTYVHGSHNELCDVCGFKFKTEDMHTRWDGLRTCHDDYEERHPMDFFRAVPDDQNVDDPDSDDSGDTTNTTLPSVIGTIPNQQNFDNDVISLDVSTAFSEGDGATVVYSTVGLPNDLVIDSTTGIISGTLNDLASDSSPYTVTVKLETSVSAIYSVNTSFSWEVLDTGPSLLVNWSAGAGSPTINGPIYTSATASATVFDVAASFFNIAADSGKYYAEFEIVTLGTVNPGDSIGFGWKNGGAINNAAPSQLIGAYWSQALTQWELNREVLGAGTENFLQTPAAPSNTTVVGVAIDASTDSVFALIDGVWMDDAITAEGGDPGAGGIGWPITNPGAAAVVLFSYTTSDNQTIQARIPQFTPSGYTPVT